MKERLHGTCYHWAGPLGSEGSGADTGESSRNFQAWPGATALLLATAPSALRVCSIDFGFPGGSVVKNHLPKKKNPHLIPRLGRSPQVGSGNPLQYSCLEKSMDRGAWWAVHGVTKSRTRLSDWAHRCIMHFIFLWTFRLKERCWDKWEDGCIGWAGVVRVGEAAIFWDPIPETCWFQRDTNCVVVSTVTPGRRFPSVTHSPSLEEDAHSLCLAFYFIFSVWGKFAKYTLFLGKGNFNLSQDSICSFKIYVIPPYISFLGLS